MDLEKEPLQSTSPAESIVDMPSRGVLNEDHLHLRVGQDNGSHRANGRARIFSRGLKGIAILLVAFLTANGFWALFRPELYGHNALFQLSGHDAHHRHKLPHQHHDHPYHRPPPPHHGPPGHGCDHPPPPPHPPHGPFCRDHPPPPPPHHGPPGRGPDHPPPPPHPPHGPPGRDHPPPPPPHHGPPGRGPDHPPPPPHPPHGPPGRDHLPPPPPHHGPPGRGSEHPPPPPPHPHPHPPKGPGKVQECFDLQEGETLEFEAPLEWAGQSVQVAPSLAGSSVIFVWDGEVGPPAPPQHIPRPGSPPPPPHRESTESQEIGDKDQKKPEKKPGHVRYRIQIPSKAEWKDAGIASQDLKICSVRRPDATGIDLFNASGIPPSHARIDPAFQKLAPLFNTTVRLPDKYARAPIRAGSLP
uniref:Uncharacterized protein n=1 Tax=Melanopsichium pennsylvanicum 4 TaxID=1398559 RepID=A0A077R0Y8_9BASI|nr:hypothetical protein BN887_00104 [Melanopsichium pennsylvanicum 4]